jgi:hypothetical protein
MDLVFKLRIPRQLYGAARRSCGSREPRARVHDVRQRVDHGHGQYAGAVVHVRDRIEVVVMQQLSKALIVREEKKSILDQRAAEGQPSGFRNRDRTRFDAL